MYVRRGSSDTTRRRRSDRLALRSGDGGPGGGRHRREHRGHARALVRRPTALEPPPRAHAECRGVLAALPVS